MQVVRMTTPGTLFILHSCLLLSLLPAGADARADADQNIIIKTCNCIDDVDLCPAILLSDPRSNNATDVTGLASIALDVAVKSINSAISQALELSHKYAGRPEEEAVNMCRELWSEAAEDLKEAQMEVDHQNYSDAAELANDAQDGLTSCENAFTATGLRSLMSDVYKAIRDRSSLAADILDLLDMP